MQNYLGQSAVCGVTGKKRLVAAAAIAFAGAIAVATAAQADVIWESDFTFVNKAFAGQTSPFGTVMIDQVTTGAKAGHELILTVTLNSPDYGFLDTGNGSNKAPFVFNLQAADQSDVTVTPTNGSVHIGNKDVAQTFTDSGFGSYDIVPYTNDTPGTAFNYGIGCCGDQNGTSHESPSPLVITIDDTAGITFVGTGVNSTPAHPGAGDQLFSIDKGAANDNTGWWFAADVTDGTNTTQIAASFADCFSGCTTQPGVPEPASWALMILGFGGVGAVLRRRRAITALA